MMTDDEKRALIRRIHEEFLREERRRRKERIRLAYEMGRLQFDVEPGFVVRAIREARGVEAADTIRKGCHDGG